MDHCAHRQSLQGDRERYLGVGMDDYLSKPIRVEELEKALTNAAVNALECTSGCPFG